MPEGEAEAAIISEVVADAAADKIAVGCQIPGTIEDAIALLREFPGGSSQAIAREVLEDARDGTLPLDRVREETLVRQALAGV